MQLTNDLELAIRQLQEAKEVSMTGQIVFHLDQGMIRRCEARSILFVDGEQRFCLVPSHGYDKGDS